MFQRTAARLAWGVRYASQHDRKWTYRSLPKVDEGTLGEKQLLTLPTTNDKESMFVNPANLNALYDGVPYDQLHVCNIKVTKNNTIMTLHPGDGNISLIYSCGIEGFKNTRKGTNIAAQATAITFAGRARDMGVTSMRVKVAGLGPGRMSSIKGLQMAGVNIVSITDSTRVSWNPPRPRKARRL